MRILPVAILVSVCLLGGQASAQEKPEAKEETRPVYTSEAMLRRIQGTAAGDPASERTPRPFRTRAQEAAATSCALPDQTAYVVNTEVTVEGRVYRCVEILDDTLQPLGAAWTPVAGR